MNINGYEMQTTFWEDFTIADAFGADAIEDTFNRAFNEWKNDVDYLIELTIVTNLKCWQFYEQGKNDVSEMYANYYHKCLDYAYSDALTPEEQRHFFKMTD